MKPLVVLSLNLYIKTDKKSALLSNDENVLKALKILVESKEIKKDKNT